MTNKEHAIVKHKVMIQIIWGIALVAAGIGIFFVMPQKVAQMQEMGQSSFSIHFTRFCFYLIGVLLIGGGAKKIYNNYQRMEKDDQN